MSATSSQAAPQAAGPDLMVRRYESEQGRVFLTGTQALVRVLVDQARRDARAGLKTGGFVSGYRGSPLGGVDLELWRAASVIGEHGIEFLPAVNEDLAATAVLGSQQVETNPKRTVDGVFALWYGKGPGVDRAGDALRHGNAYGSSPHGGVLVVAGDDHGCVSSSMPHQSDVAFMTWFMPTLNPASVAEYLSFGEYGFALSRASGMWVGFKAISETVESGASVELSGPREFRPMHWTPPAGGLHYRWPDLPGPQIEERMEAKKAAVQAFAEANPIDREIYGIPDAPFGIVTTGKAHLDLMEALRLLGLDEPDCRRLGIDVYKVGMVWPLARRDALAFVRGKREILVVEEKRGIVESQFKEYFYDYPGDKPDRMVGKTDENGDPLVPWTGELSPHRLLPIVAARLDQHFPERRLPRRAEEILAHGAAPIEVTGATRTPYFCSGCPHNRSTRVPDGSQALAGIGCHFMASWMDRNTTSLIQMGGEGVNWAASSRFTGHGHVFQNLGEGTWYHSGSMAIRQAIAAGANITYKVLFNDAVAMTGGQPVDGPVSPQSIAQAARAEGVARIAIVSDEPQAFSAPAFPPGVTIHHRDELDPLQRELRTVPGVSMLIYVQACATEKRRRRKRGQIEDPARQPFINTLVCEGCGDCSTRSNCLSVEPVDTPFGRKRRINMSSCNKDFSCVDGFCPSFVTVHGHPRRRPSGGLDPMKRTAALPMPTQTSLEAPYDLLVTGVGGTGVITVGALISMAAHLDGLGVSVLDFTGFAQKFGPVLSFLRLAASPSGLNQVRIERGSADALIGCDVVVSSSPKASLLYRPGMRAVVNLAQMPTGDVVRHRDATLSVDARVAAIRAAIGDEGLSTLDANRAAEALLGDTVFANVMMLGHAWQRGLVPVSLEALLRAIELNGAAPDANRRAFAWGRLSAADPEFVAQAIGDTRPRPETLDEIIARHAGFLRDYQNDAFARHYVDWLARVREAEQPLGSEAMSRAVATTLFRLMAVKDEYEVARLHLDPSFRRELDARFEAGYRLTYHFAAPWLSRRRDAEGHPRKLAFGEWVRWPLRILASLRRLRASALDPFARGGERREAAELLDWYERTLVELLPRLNADTLDDAVRIAAAPQSVRGFGHVRSARVGPLMAEVEGLLAKLSPAAPRATPMKRERDPVDATPANAR